jgi:hypothetical protein
MNTLAWSLNSSRRLDQQSKLRMYRHLRCEDDLCENMVLYESDGILVRPPIPTRFGTHQDVFTKTQGPAEIDVCPVAKTCKKITGHAYRLQRGFSVFSGACLFWRMDALRFPIRFAFGLHFASSRGARPHEVVTCADPFLGCFFD